MGQRPKETMKQIGFVDSILFINMYQTRTSGILDMPTYEQRSNVDGPNTAYRWTDGFPF